MSFVVDASYGHAKITPANMAAIGATGAILYAGCSDAGKNATKAEVQTLLDAGIHVGLVIENTAQGMAGGASVGARLGEALLAGAKAVGYDVDNCALYTAADWNSRGTDLDGIDAAMHAFGQVVPHPGLYGNSYALDRCAQTGHAEFFWQSDSAAFSNGPSAHAHLLQRFNDPRAHGLPLDVNDIQNTPLGLMGETMSLDPNDPVIVKLEASIAALAAEVQSLATVQVWGDKTHPNNLNSIGTHVTALAAAVAQLEKLVTTSANTTSLTPAQIASQLHITAS